MHGKVFLEKQRKYFDFRIGRDLSHLCGKVYHGYVDLEHDLHEHKKTEPRRILDALHIKMSDHVADGLALLLDDEYWFFGCKEEDVSDWP